MMKSEHLGNTYLEMARVLNKSKEDVQSNLLEAIEYQSKAVMSFSGLEKYADTDYLAGIIMQLSELQDKAGQTEDALESLRIVEKIYKNNYSDVHAKTCKVKRNISLLCLKSDRNDDALNELREVEDLERALYGESSNQVGKTYKVIGTIHLLNKNNLEAREYLQKAQAIFEQKGLLKLLKEVKHKLKLLNPDSSKLNQMMNDGSFNAQQMLGVGANMESEEEDVTSPESMAVKKKAGKKANKKKAVGQKFNNFMSDK